jgi:hypothetical protein
MRADNVVSLADAKRRRAMPPRDRSRPQAEVRGGIVVMLELDRDVPCSQAVTRAFASRLEALADFAEGAPTVPGLSDAEVRARLALLGDVVSRMDGGRARISDVMALVRQLTAEVRRG